MNSTLIAGLLKPHLLQRIWKKIRFLFVVDQWIILISRNTDYKSLAWDKFKRLIPPLDRFWADPFVWFHENIYYIFIEEVLYKTHRGRIVCLTLDKDLNIQFSQIVLERPYHLSYPFLFQHKDQLYMIPETKENNQIELYSCANFPNQWKFEKTLIKDIYALDVTLLEAHGKWWLFTYIPTAGSKWDTLHLYYADHPLSDQWTAHPCNPVVNDIHSARPAGRIFSDNGQLIRPAQDCSVRYGYAIRFNQITTLTETEYAESSESTFKPIRKNSLYATHTYNEMQGVTVIDGILRRRRI